MAEVNQTPAAFQRHPDTSTIEKLLRDCEVGSIVTYDALSERLGRDVRKHCCGYCQTAIRSLAKEGIAFVTVRKVGFQRVTETEKVTVLAHRRLTSGRRRFREGAAILGRVDMRELDDEHRNTALTMHAQCKAAELFTSAQGTKRIEAALATATELPPIGRVLELFQK